MLAHVLGFFILISAVSPGFSLVLNPKGRLEGLGGKTESACQELEDNEAGTGLMIVTVLVLAQSACPG